MRRLDLLFVLFNSIFLASCAHLEVDALDQCEELRISPGDGGLLPSVPVGVTYEISRSVTVQTHISPRDSQRAKDFNVSFSDIVLQLDRGTFAFADRVLIQMDGQDPVRFPRLTLSERRLSSADAESGVLSLPIVPGEQVLTSYLESGSIVVTLVVTAHALPPGAITMRVCHQLNAVWDWNAINGVH